MASMAITYVIVPFDEHDDDASFDDSFCSFCVNCWSFVVHDLMLTTTSATEQFMKQMSYYETAAEERACTAAQNRACSIWQV